MYDSPMFIPQGWQCPVCHRVYSPTTPMCFNCVGDVIVANTTYEQKKDEIIRKIMVGDTPETMKQQTTDGGLK